MHGVLAARDFDAGKVVLPIDDSRIVDADHPLLLELEENDYCDYLVNRYGNRTINSDFFGRPSSDRSLGS